MNKHDRLNELISWLSGIEGEHGGEKEQIIELLVAGQAMRQDADILNMNNYPAVGDWDAALGESK